MIDDAIIAMHDGRILIPMGPIVLCLPRKNDNTSLR